MVEKKTEKLTLEERVEALEHNTDLIGNEFFDLRRNLKTILDWYKTESILISVLIALLLDFGFWFFLIR